MTCFTGIWVPLVTPFQDGAINFAALQSTARRLRDAGIAGLVACGTTGEPAAMSDEEQLAVLDAVIAAVPDCPVVMGLSDNNMASVLTRLRPILARKIAGLLMPPPYYIRPSQAGLLEYFTTVADAATVPLILYNIPYRTGVAMTLDTIRRLAQHPRVLAIKDCGGDLGLTMQLIADAELAVMAGEDQQILTTLCLGGAGAIAASAHLRPDLFVRLARQIQDGDLPAARQIFYRLLPLIQSAFAEPNPAPVKAALASLGHMRAELRSPMQAASATMREQIVRELQRLEGC